MTEPELEPIGVSEALEMFHQDSTGRLSPNTVAARRRRLAFFERWCDGEDNGDSPRVTDLTELTGRDIFRFRQWRGENINKVTMQTQLSDLRQFLKFCVQIDAVPESMPDKVGKVVLEHGENEREEFLPAGEARDILRYLDRYHYALMDNCLFLLAWRTGARKGGIHSLDVPDIDFENSRLTFEHRPESDTYLKNGYDGERTVALREETTAILRDYVENNREEVKHDYGREPLFSSVHGRFSKSQLSRHMYMATLPCFRGEECPAGKDPAECEYAASYNDCIKCPYNVRPHDIRRGSITRWLKEEKPDAAISDRANVSLKTLDKHYDRRTKSEKAESRRQFFD